MYYHVQLKFKLVSNTRLFVSVNIIEHSLLLLINVCLAIMVQMQYGQYHIS